MKHINPLTCIDFYKADHRRQYPEGTALVVSNLTPRSGKHANVENRQEVVFFGLQYFLKHFLCEVWKEGFFDLPKEEAVSAYRRRMDTSLGAGAIPVDHVEALHDLGFLPVEIRALPEGSAVPVGVPCLTIHNTRPEFFWLTNYLETILSAYLWLPCTSATTARNYRKTLEEYANRTGTAGGFADFQAHDFSFRGMGSLQSALISGAAHLLFFKGTDTVAAIDLLEQYYHADANAELIGCSVPATEHSVMCMGGEESEIETFRRLITHLYPRGIVSIVSDTWDFWKVISEYALALHQEIMSREGKVVFRPDSGDPYKILCGAAVPLPYPPTPEVVHEHVLSKGFEFFRMGGCFYRANYGALSGKYHVDANTPTVTGQRTVSWEEVPASPELYGAVEVLWKIFGGTETETGHLLLDPHVGLIYGDSITPRLARRILAGLEQKGFASGNVVFGVGSFTYQYVTRDTWGFAVKATYGEVGGESRSIYKSPKTDDGLKKSAKGLVLVNERMELEQGVSWEDFRSDRNLLRPVYRDGLLLRDESLSEIRARVAGIAEKRMAA